MNATLTTATQVLDMLTAEGHDRDDVIAAYDSLIDAGLEVANDANALTAGDIEVLRDQLNS